ncbi:MAG: sulfatase-like hydrolase/transferase [Opitutaceae bacterium]|nr:sulfatase-like hydrolase/transferase [Opitutaceae bacterium]
MHVSRRLALAFALPLLLAAAAPAAAPNFLLIFTDDHGVGDVSAYGSRDVLTPHLDRLAAEGMLFTRMRANCTVCSPSRAALMTGRYADRVGVPGVIRTQPANSWGYLAPGVPTLADHLRPAGYATAIIGKWHLGLESPNTPTERGFEFFHGFLGDMMDSFTTHLRHGQNYMRRNREVISPTGHATELFTDWSVAYLRERARDRRPFFLYLAYNAPHFPIEPPAAWLARVKQRAPDLPEKRALNVAFVEHLDDAIGRVLAALQETGLDRNTLVVFSADNGGSLPHGQSNDPWRDGKQSHYDGGLRVPFIARWPGVIAAGSRSDYAGLAFDAGATFLEAAGVARPAGLDAVSLLPILRGGTPDPKPRELYFVRREGGPAYGGKSYEALIRGDWKLMQNSPYAPLELYNLKDDPQEQKNVIQQHPAVARDLESALRIHIQRGGATPWQPPISPRP